MSATITPITWADAELIFPGCYGEWRHMVGQKGDYCPRSNIQVRCQVREYIHETKPHKQLEIVELDPDNKWLYPPSWVRGVESPGKWRSPIPLSRKLAFFNLPDYKYK